jgi:hypothetical protein
MLKVTNKMPTTKKKKKMPAKKKSKSTRVKIARQSRRNKLMMLIVVLLVAGIGVKLLISSFAATSNFTLIGTHPQAALQPTAWGKTIQALKVWNGKLYSGYGDWNANTGPISLTPLDLTTNTFATTPELNAQTETIDKFRVLGGNLFAPSIDPSGGYSTDYVFANLLNGAANWQQVGPNNTLKGVKLAHAFDMATLTGSDLWIVGADYDTAQAVVWRSLDGGTTWTKMLSVPPKSTGDETRMYGIGVLNGKVYVQATEISGTTGGTVGEEQNSHVFDGTSWSNGPNLFAYSYAYHDQAFAGKLVYLGNASPTFVGPTGLTAFDGNKAQAVSAPSSFYDFDVDGGTLYAVGSNGNIYSTTDLVNWITVQVAPAGARSITESNGIVYVGTTDSKIYSYNLANGVIGGTSGGGTTGGTKCHGKGAKGC